MKYLLAFALIATTAVLPSMTHAWGGYVSDLDNGWVNSCANCHISPSGGGDRNAFGTDFGVAGYTASLEIADSDMDGFLNWEELQDPDYYVGGGDPLLVSSPGFAFSTPGERALQLSEVLLQPEDEQGDHQIIEITNPLVTTVDAGGLYLVSTDAQFQIPSAEAVNTEIPGGGTLKILIDSDNANEPGVISEPVSGGLLALQTNSDFVTLHWISDLDMKFNLPVTVLDHVQWQRELSGQLTAVNAFQWGADTYVEAPDSGKSMVYDGSGDTASDWLTDQPPTLDVFEIGRMVRALLGIIPASPSPEYNDNLDNAIDSADLVTRINTSN